MGESKLIDYAERYCLILCEFFTTKNEKEKGMLRIMKQEAEYVLHKVLGLKKEEVINLYQKIKSDVMSGKLDDYCPAA